MLAAALGSGSAGNSYLFESDGTSILIDAGFGTRETAKRLATIGRSLESIQAIVLTHEHYDHIRGAERLALKLGIPIYLTEGTLDASTLDRTSLKTAVFENNRPFRIGELQIHPRRTLHDAADPACYVVESRAGNRIGLATDLGHADDPVIAHLRQCDALFFEANHDLDMLRAGTYPWSLKRRIMSRVGHLSNDDSMAALLRLMGPRLTNLCLIHLSEKNNHESIVRTMAEEMLLRSGAHVQLSIARQRAAIEAVLIAGQPLPFPPPPVTRVQLSLF
jgi:phosphoribosyl 1,2-cyclic phosphodiesterase